MAITAASITITNGTAGTTATATSTTTTNSRMVHPKAVRERIEGHYRRATLPAWIVWYPGLCGIICRTTR